MSADISFTRENIDIFLKELAKEYRKLGGKSMPAEIILTGGAAILANYRFRESTYDMDAVIYAASSMKEAINHVGDRFSLPNGWLNTDFMKTTSYTPKLGIYSTYYKTFSNVLTVRIVAAEYLVAMKLKSGRKYKNDLSDVVGILYEHQLMGNSISIEQIKMAVEHLYGRWDSISCESIEFIESVFMTSDLEAFYLKCRSAEKDNKRILLDFQDKYPGAANQENINDILKRMKEKKETIQIENQRSPHL